MKNTTVLKISLPMIFVLATGLSGCNSTTSSSGGGGTPVTPSSLVTAVQDVGDAASVTVVTASALEAANIIPSSTAQIIETAGAAASTACDESVTELQSTDANSVMALKITGYFTAVSVNVTGMPPQAVSLLNVLSMAIQGLLKQLGSPAVGAAMARADAVKVVKVTPMMVLSKQDKKALVAVQVKARGTAAAGSGWRPTHAQ